MKYLIAFLLIFSSFVFAETSGDINTSLPQPIATGFYAYTASTCTSSTGNPPSGCGTYSCFFENGSTSTGYCRPSSNLQCYEAGTWYNDSTSSPSCKNSTHKWSCSSGSWSASACTNGCSSGSCANTSTTTTIAATPIGVNIATTTTTIAASSNYQISITSGISNFQIIQGNSALKSVTIKNTGKDKTNNTVLTISGISSEYVSVSPASFSQIDVGASKTFTVNFTVTNNVTVKEYDMIHKAKSDQTEASGSFKMKVLPSNDTVQKVILPRYANYSQLIAELEKNITALKSTGVNTTEMESTLEQIKAKINQASSSLESADYFAASASLDEADSLVSGLIKKIQDARAEQGSGIMILAVGAVILMVLAIVGYMLVPPKTTQNALNKMKSFLPSKNNDKTTGFLGKTDGNTGYKPGRGFIPSQDNQADKILEDLQKKKKEKIRYQFGGGE